MGDRSVATIVPANIGYEWCDVGIYWKDGPSNAPRKTALHRPASTQQRSTLDILFRGLNSGIDGDVGVSGCSWVSSVVTES